MAKWVVAFALAASVAASVGFGNTSGLAASLGQLGFFGGLIGLLVSVVLGAVQDPRSQRACPERASRGARAMAHAGER